MNSVRTMKHLMLDLDETLICSSPLYTTLPKINVTVNPHLKIPSIYFLDPRSRGTRVEITSKRCNSPLLDGISQSIEAALRS